MSNVLAPSTREALAAAIGVEQGPTAWRTIDQEQIDLFARATGDHQFIHVDPVRAAATPFGGTIAHGFLMLSLLPVLHDEVVPPVAGTTMRINYGLNRVRFTEPVRVSRRVRGYFTLTTVEPRGPDRVQTITEARIEIEGADRPALVAERITLLVF